VQVNGADLWMRGANVIPMEELESRESEAAYRALVSHAQAAGENVVRVWGGGKFLPRAFYDAVDAAGLMVIQVPTYLPATCYLPPACLPAIIWLILLL
jgi:beta-mannosidase